jgi:DNA uptake protein ComE-like DNA-binding protein
MFRMKSAAAVVALVLFAAPLALAQGATPSGTEPAKPAEKPATTAHHSSTSTKSAPKVDINSASKEQLMKLPGVGDATADKIIAGRPFKSKSELESKGIMTKTEYNKVSAHVVAHQEKAAATTEKK